MTLQVLLMKSFLQQRGLNDVYSGGLGSFALTLMLVFYLEVIFWKLKRISTLLCGDYACLLHNMPSYDL